MASSISSAQRPLLPTSSSSQPYHQYLSLIPSDLPDIETRVEQIRQAWQDANWDAPIFGSNCQNLFPHYALIALTEGKIDSRAFATIALFWSIIKNHSRENVLTFRLFLNDGSSINPLAHFMIKRTMSPDPKSVGVQNGSYSGNFIDDDKINALFLEMKGQSAAEQQFWLS